MFLYPDRGIAACQILTSLYRFNPIEVISKGRNMDERRRKRQSEMKREGPRVREGYTERHKERGTHSQRGIDREA